MKKAQSALRSEIARRLSDVGQQPGFTPIPRMKKERGKREGQTNMTFFMALSTNTALKVLAMTRGISMQQLVAEFVDKGLAEAGEAPFKVRDE